MNSQGLKDFYHFFMLMPKQRGKWQKENLPVNSAALCHDGTPQPHGASNLVHGKSTKPLSRIS